MHFINKSYRKHDKLRKLGLKIFNYCNIIQYKILKITTLLNAMR